MLELVEGCVFGISHLFVFIIVGKLPCLLAIADLERGIEFGEGGTDGKEGF